MVDPSSWVQQVAGPAVIVAGYIYSTRRGYLRDLIEKVEEASKKANVVAVVAEAVARRDPALDADRIREAVQENGVQVEDFIRDDFPPIHKEPAEKDEEWTDP